MSDRSEKSLRAEFNSRSFKAAVREKHGCNCVNCGSSENIEYHHIVPISLGGTNAISNVVPICHKCHKAAHCGRHMNHYRERSAGGRKRKASDEDFYRVCDLWLDGQIGNIKRAEMLGVSVRTRQAQFDNWLADRGLKSVRNMVDYVMSIDMGSLLREGRTVGKVTRLDGSTFEIYFNDTGLNDDVEYPVFNGRRVEVGRRTFGRLKEEAEAECEKIAKVILNERRARDARLADKLREEKRREAKRAEEKMDASRLFDGGFSDLAEQLFEDKDAMRRVMGASLVRNAI